MTDEEKLIAMVDALSFAQEAVERLKDGIRASASQMDGFKSDGRRNGKYDWHVLKNVGDSFLFPCPKADQDRVRRSIAVGASNRFGAGFVRTKVVGAGVKVTLRKPLMAESVTSQGLRE